MNKFPDIENSHIENSHIVLTLAADNLFRLGDIVDTLERAKLDRREILVLFLRFNGKKTFKEIGDGLDLSKERIRQIEAKALSKLRRSFGKDQTLSIVKELVAFT